jgi:hypothetical protein
MTAIIILAFGLIFSGVVQAQVGSSISSDGTAPNNNAMLDVQSPATGDGKGILIPRVTQAQRMTASSSLAGGLLDNSGNLRGGAAQGLIVYQTDGDQGLYFNTSQSAVPVWVYLGTSTTNYLPLTGGTMSGAINMGGQVITNAAYYGDGNGITNIPTTSITENDPRWASASNAVMADINTRLASNVWAAADSTTNYLPRTGGTMSGTLNMGAQIVTNVSHIDFTGFDVAIGRAANGLNYGAAVGRQANGYYYSAALGYMADGSTYGAAIGYQANGASYGAAVGRDANGYSYGAAAGRQANGYRYGMAMGYLAKGTNYGAAVGHSANGSDGGAAVGDSADGSDGGAAVGASAKGFDNGAAVGYLANGANYGAALGDTANGTNYGAALGSSANGDYFGTALGSSANGFDYGIAVGRLAKGTNIGTAVGKSANGSDYGAALGREANGYNVGAAVGCYAKGANNGVAVGYSTEGTNYGVAIGWDANGAQTNVAIGWYANAQGGTERIAIGHNVTNTVDNTARIRGTLYLDGGTGIVYRATHGEGAWAAKAFTIDHPLDPENRVLRHFCLEGPQVWNVYAGNVQLVNGQAVVQLPDYYSALNLVGSEIYSLTPISSDRSATAVIEQEVMDNRFIIGGSSDMKVSWTIKVLRNDPGCLEDLRRRPVEQLKSEIGQNQ